MLLLCDAPAFARAPRSLLQPATKLHGSHRAYGRKFRARLPAPVVNVCRRRDAVPRQRVPPATICPRDNRKAYRGSLDNVSDGGKAGDDREVEELSPAGKCAAFQSIAIRMRARPLG